MIFILLGWLWIPIFIFNVSFGDILDNEFLMLIAIIIKIGTWCHLSKKYDYRKMWLYSEFPAIIFVCLCMLFKHYIL